MDKESVARLVTAFEARRTVRGQAEPIGIADDGFEIAHALLQVLGRRLGIGFVLEVQAEILKRAERHSRDVDAQWRADAVEIAAVANAGYFTDLIDELTADLPTGRA